MFNTPNLLTLLRLALAPVFVYFLSLDAHWAIAACFATGAAMGVTDILDGYFGRKLNQITDLGKILDPTVDKIAAVTMLGGLYWFRELPLAFIIFKIIKELLFLPRGIIILKRPGNIPSANRWGKTACVILFAAMIPYVINAWSDTRVYFLWVAAVVEIVALISYYAEFFRDSAQREGP
jgi:CDP-diacylglycerol--glycerol-3-phosphate 3-phosphatidyltransferase